MTTQTSMRVWFFGASGCVAGNVAVASMDDARSIAARWNRDEKRADMRVNVIANAPVAAQASRVSTVA